MMKRQYLHTIRPTVALILVLIYICMSAPACKAHLTERPEEHVTPHDSLPPATDPDSFQAAITFDKASVDLGELTPDSGKQKFEFKFVNTGNAPLVLTYVHASCSCIGLEYPRVPIAPGDSARIKGFLNPATIHEAAFKRDILIRSNGRPGSRRVFIVGKMRK